MLAMLDRVKALLDALPPEERVVRTIVVHPDRYAEMRAAAEVAAMVTPLGMLAGIDVRTSGNLPASRGTLLNAAGDAIGIIDFAEGPLTEARCYMFENPWRTLSPTGRGGE